jgi:hypothetical protein
MRYAVIVEEGETSFGAYVPDLPGCVAVAETKAEVLRLIERPSNSTSTVCVKTINQFLDPLPVLNTSKLKLHSVQNKNAARLHERRFASAKDENLST